MELRGIECFDEICAIMESSFPTAERRERQAQRELFFEPEYRLYVEEENGRAAAFLAVWELNCCEFIEHFAVSGDMRGSGIGGRMIDELRSKAKKPVCLEVERPKSDEAHRRIAFYEHHGFTLTPYGYIQPPLNGNGGSVRLEIMSDAAMDERQFREFARETFKTVYKVQE